MLVLLPESDQKRPQRIPVADIYGPKVSCLQLTPEAAAELRDIELGRGPAPELIVERSSHRLVVIGEEGPKNLRTWLICRFGGFSTALVRYVDLKGNDRTTNSAAQAAVQLQTAQELVNLLGADPPMTEDDLPAEPEDDDDWLDEEPEGPELPFDDEVDPNP